MIEACAAGNGATATGAGGSRADGHRCGFVALAGRPNAGKSTLLNRLVGDRVSIVSRKPQTTRSEHRGVLTRPGAQVVFVDTPGIHKPRSDFGRRLNASAAESLHGADVACLVIDASARFGTGDAFIARTLPPDSVVVVTKSDLVGPDQMLTQLAAAGELDFESYFAVSGVTGEGVDAFLGHVAARLPQGPPLYPPDVTSCVPEAVHVAELVREQLLGMVRDELHHCITTRVTDWEWPVIRCEIVVERPSQKGIVIGRRGERVKRVGTAVRSRLREGAHLDLVVTVDRHWRRADRWV